MATICMHHVVASLHGIREKQLDEKAILSSAGINPAILHVSNQRVHTDLVARLFKKVQLELNDEFMGFTQNPCKAGLFALMCQLVSSSQNLGDLLERGAHFYNLTSNDITMELQLNDVSDLAIYQIQLHRPELDADHFLAEFLLVIWHRFASWYIGEPIKLRETHFTFSKPEHEKELEIMFPGKLRYQCQNNRLLFDRQYLTKPLIRTREELLDFAENAPADVMTIPGLDSTLEMQIERSILQKSPDKLLFPSLHQLAKDLGSSPQTLHRHLKKNGSSYQKLKDNLRRQTAIRKLMSSNLSIDQISEIVGFAESRSFTRAFKQWTGLSPRAYRKVSQ